MDAAQDCHQERGIVSFRCLHRFLADESGPTATEYAVMMAVILLGSMGIIGMLGQKFAVLYAIISAAIPDGFA